MATVMRKTGIEVVGDMPWGTHFCLFYETTDDLLRALVPYCKSGLENQEFRLWVVAEPLTVENAIKALSQAIPEFDRYSDDGSIEIVAARDWYLQDGTFDLARVISGWNEKLARASARGYAGVRVTGDTAWLEKKDWKDFCEYEESLNVAIANQRLAVLCTYPLAACGSAEILDVVRTHQFAVTRRRGSWDIIETAGYKQAKAEIKRLSDELEQRVRDRTHQLTAVNEELTKEVSERRRAEGALLRSEAYLAEAQKLSHTGSWAWDPGTETVLYWSEEMFRICGLDPQQGVPTGYRFGQLVHPEDNDRVYEHVQKSVTQKSDYVLDYRIVLPDQTVRHIETIGHPVLNTGNGEVSECVGTALDVTERKRAEQERERFRQLEADLAHMNRVSMLGELTASLGHEIKQPIAAAVSNAEACLQWLAREQPDLAEVREAAAEMVKEARRAADIMTRVRSLFIKEGIARAVLDVNEVITDTIILVREEADRRSITVRTELDAALPRISADRVQLQQVLMNLMLNGLEAMRDTTGELIIRSQRDEQGRALISVSDVGTGLPAVEGDKIFDAFFTTKAQGTGMGLAISRSIVESHGGQLWATGHSGNGATFKFALPATAAAHA